MCLHSHVRMGAQQKLLISALFCLLRASLFTLVYVYAHLCVTLKQNALFLLSRGCACWGSEVSSVVADPTAPPLNPLDFLEPAGIERPDESKTLWYKDALFYEISVRAFADAGGTPYPGIGNLVCVCVCVCVRERELACMHSVWIVCVPLCQVCVYLLCVCMCTCVCTYFRMFAYLLSSLCACSCSLHAGIFTMGEHVGVFMVHACLLLRL